MKLNYYLSLAALIPAAILFVRIYQLDHIEKEPRRLLGKLVLFGALAAVPAALAQLDELWQADQVYLHIVVTHGDINNAETLLRRAVLLCQADSEELRPTLAELHACLGMVAETQQISIKNIL